MEPEISASSSEPDRRGSERTPPVTPLVEIEDLTRAFPGVLALDGVSLDVHPGEIIALVGQNGSGKSTLVKLLAGVIRPDRGTIRLAGEGGPGGTGLHFIHQDLGIVGALSTVENLELWRGKPSLVPTRRRRERAHAKELVNRFGVSFDVTVPTAKLSPEERSIVAIARALDGWTTPHNVLILDEPTAALQADEVQRLFGAIRSVAASGAGVIFISHRLDEVLDIADRVVVLRDGRLVADEERAKIDHGELVRLIAGKALDEVGVDSPQAPGDVVLEVDALAGATVRGVDLDVRAGEVVGVSGVVGSGREQLCALLAGATERDNGKVAIAGRALKRGPAAAIAGGVGFIPADRHRDGGVMTHNARENLTLPMLRPLRRAFGRIDRAQERREVDTWMSAVTVRPHDPERRLALFSGGNQQKVILAKWLRTEPKVLLMDEPTQGVDVSAKVSIYDLIRRAGREGASVVVSSSDTKELAALCDRVVVMREGRIVGEVPRGPNSEEEILTAMMGVGNV